MYHYHSIIKILVLLLPLYSSKLAHINPQFLSLISTGSQIKASGDAIQAVLQVLTDLKGANEENARQSAIFFREYEQQALGDISTFSRIMNQNSASQQSGVDDLDALNDKIAQTEDYLDWNEKRRASNTNKVEILAEQRCEANSLFIDTLREYKEALDVLDQINGDIENREKHTNLLQKEDLNEYADKLNVYTKLYKETAVNEFIKLGENKMSFIQSAQGNLFIYFNPSLEEQQNNEQIAGSTVSAAVAKIQQLIGTIRDAIKNLEEQEITSANDFVDFRNNILNEQVSLSQEYESRKLFHNSLLNDLELANNVVNQGNEVLQNTQIILQQCQDQYKQQQKQNSMENEKRHQENQSIEEIILIYKNKIADAKVLLQEYAGDNRYDSDDEE